ncbi:hypothetical protein B0H19DRAFT_919335 [Mycena capillaripes]|nr:hypothetical protein B0H19DRAFT_919335 [Mycena capillaripes]
MALTLVSAALLVLTSAISVGAESHTVKFDNRCGYGTPQLIKGGDVLTTTSYTSTGELAAAIASSKNTGSCGFNGEHCTLLELTMTNPVAVGGGSSADISLIDPFYDGCDGIGTTCDSPGCNTAFKQPDDTWVQVACQDDNANLLITFCPDGSSSSSSHSSTSALFANMLSSGPNEKVLNYLEGMSREGNEADDTPPRSIADDEEYKHRNGLYSPTARSRNSEALRDLAASPVSYDGRLNNGARRFQIIDHGDDADSVEQNGQRSEFGGQALPINEPGPNDDPGPHYPSYDSGPSFGNFGPMPDDGALNNVMMSTWTPNWTQQIDKPMPELPDLNKGSLTPGYHKVPLPESVASPRGTSVNIDIESPSSPRSRAMPSQASRKAPTVRSEQASATGAGVGEDNRPWSPMSGRSRVTKATEKGTAYPALPESRIGGDDLSSPPSPTRSKAVRSKAPSSESPSQTKVQHSTAKSPSHKEPSNIGGGQSHQNRPFSPYRHAPTTEDLLHAAIRGRAVALTDAVNGKSPSQHSRAPSAVPPSKAPSAVPSAAARSRHTAQAPTPAQSHKAASAVGQDGAATPSQRRPHSPLDLNPEEAQIVQNALASRTPRTSHYTPSALGSDIVNSHFHDMDLCVLLQQESDPNVHEVVKKALRKAIRQRVKKLGMKYDNESIKQYRRMHDHDPSVHLNPDDLNDEPPKWAADLKREIVLMQQRIESLGPKIEGLKAPSHGEDSKYGYEGEPEQYTETPATRTINIHTQPTGTLADSMYQHPETEMILEENDDGSDDATETPQRDHPHQTESDGLSQHRNIISRDDSPGQQYLEEELYKLRQKPHGSNSRLSHHSWEVARDDEPDYDEEHGEHGPSPTGLQTIPDRDSNAADPPADDAHQEVVATPQPPWHSGDVSHDSSQHLPPWQRIHQRLLSWAIIWPASDFDAALNSTTRNQQVNEVALTIWSMQTYKRYVRAKLTDSPQGVVDRLFVPPNMADAISNAVFNGRHGDACGMLRDLWSPFGLEGMPRLLIVLAKHRSDPNHWVVHRFSLPEGALTTYDSYPERTLPDGRPLGWWFAIRVAWPNAIYPSPDHLMQKMVRLHRPLQLGIDNSVAACGLWRNILMGSRAERSLDLERLRDLINTEVKNLRQKKQIGKLSIGAPRPVWDFTMGQ